ncbi:MAG: hypothetical protein RLZZ387_5566 [Chloroflexota bacterium]|jgi:tetratricopeptide (TPR) repeat protein
MTNRLAGYLGRLRGRRPANQPDTPPQPPGGQLSPGGAWLGRLQEAAHSQRLRVGAVTIFLALLVVILLPRLLPGISSEEFTVLVAPFTETTPDSDTGASVARELARALNSGDGAIVAQVIDTPPDTTTAAVQLARSRGADVVIWGRITPGGMLDQASLLPELAYVPSGSFAPAAWDGYLGRFAMPEHYTLASSPVVGGTVMPQLIRALADYGAGRVDRAIATLESLAGSTPALSTTLPSALRGNVLWARGEYRSAAEDYRRAIGDGRGPGAARLYNNLGAVLQDAGDPSAREALNQAVLLLDEQDADLGQLRYNLALEALRDDRPAAAVSSFEAIAPLNEERRLLEPLTPLLVDASRAYRLNLQLEQAGAMLAEAERRASLEDVLAPPELRDLHVLRMRARVNQEAALLGLARAVDARGPVEWELQGGNQLDARQVTALEQRIGTALDESQRLVELWSRRSTAEDAANNILAGRVAVTQSRLATARIVEQRRVKAILDVERLRAEGVRPRGGLDALWATLSGTGSPIGPIEEELQGHIAAEPNNPEPLILLGRAYLAAGQEGEAAQQFQAAVQLDPQAPEPLYGQALIALPEDPARARQLLLQSIGLRPDYFPARQLLAELAEQEQDWATAIEQRTRLYEQRPEPAAALALATTLRLSGPSGYTQAESTLLPLANADNVPAMIELAELYRAYGDLAAARRVLERAEQLTPRGADGYPDVAYEMGRLMVEEENIAEAEIQFEAALSADPRHIPSLLALAQINRANPQIATRHYRAALEAGADDPSALQLIGTTLLAYREHELAVTAFERAVAAAPTNPQARYGLALARLRQEQLELAQAEAQAAIEAAGGAFPEAQVVLGDVALRRGEVAAAVQEYNAALRQNDSLAAAYIGLGRAAVIEGRWAVATGHFRNAVTRDPTSAEARLWLGEALLHEGDPRAAAEAYAAAIARRPDYAEAYLGLAQAQIQLGQIVQAEDSLQRAQDLRPEYAEAYLVRGRLYEQQGRDERAIEDYTRAIQASGSLAEPHYRRALLLIRQDRIDDARSDLEEAVRIQPAFPEAQYWLGRVYFAQGRHEAAAERFRQASAQQPGYAEALYYRGLAEERAGRPADAVASYRAAAEQGVGTVWAGEAQEALVRLAGQ